MGFGFNLFFVFILVPLTGILLVTWLLTRKKIFGKTLGLIWLGIFGLAFLSGIAQWLSAKTLLEKKDYYGEYIVNRDYFPGRQADWQYNNFKFYNPIDKRIIKMQVYKQYNIGDKFEKEMKIGKWNILYSKD